MSKAPYSYSHPFPLFLYLLKFNHKTAGTTKKPVKPIKPVNLSISIKAYTPNEKNKQML